jgi:hypothetical protein
MSQVTYYVALPFIFIDDGLSPGVADDRSPIVILALQYECANPALRLFGFCREWPHRRTGEEGDERAPLHCQSPDALNASVSNSERRSKRSDVRSGSKGEILAPST